MNYGRQETSHSAHRYLVAHVQQMHLEHSEPLASPSL